jgi:hypothetical protein
MSDTPDVTCSAKQQANAINKMESDWSKAMIEFLLQRNREMQEMNMKLLDWLIEPRMAMTPEDLE